MRILEHGAPLNSMNSLHSPKATCTFALLLGCLVALLLTPASRGADSFRLDRVAIVRFTPTPDGRMNIAHGILDLTENITWRGTTSVPRIAGIPAWALDRNLARVDTWQVYYALGDGEVVANFAVEERGARVVIDGHAYIAVAVSPTARVFTGGLINISTRTRVAAGGDVVIAGFVVEERPRAVLIRAVGPGLRQFNVPGATPDPFLSVKRNGATLHFNDNWDTGLDAALIARATARVGAFPLAANSRDAARVVILGPGAYTVHVQTAAPDVAGGDVLIEVYGVPEDVFDAP